MDLIDIEMATIPKRCGGDNRVFSQLTMVDWVVLDFTNGKRSFKDMSIMLPTEQSALMASFRHLRALGFISWDQVSNDVRSTTQGGFMNKMREATRNPAPQTQQTIEVGIAMADLSDDSCLQFLPQKLLIPFRAFLPTMTDPTLDMDLGTQALIEFLLVNLPNLTPREILGVSNQADSAEIRQAYLKRSRLFHPDRYFRKNIGQFQTHLATLFKAVSKAYTSLQQP